MNEYVKRASDPNSVASIAVGQEDNDDGNEDDVMFIEEHTTLQPTMHRHERGDTEDVILIEQTTFGQAEPKQQHQQQQQQQQYQRRRHNTHNESQIDSKRKKSNDITEQESDAGEMLRNPFFRERQKEVSRQIDEDGELQIPQLIDLTKDDDDIAGDLDIVHVEEFVVNETELEIIEEVHQQRKSTKTYRNKSSKDELEMSRHIVSLELTQREPPTFQSWELKFFFIQGIVRPTYINSRTLRCMMCCTNLDENFESAMNHCLDDDSHKKMQSLVLSRIHDAMHANADSTKDNCDFYTSARQFASLVEHCYQNVNSMEDARKSIVDNVDKFLPILETTGRYIVDLRDDAYMEDLFKESIYVPIHQFVLNMLTGSKMCSTFCLTCYWSNNWDPLAHIEAFEQHRLPHRRRELACLLCDVPMMSGISEDNIEKHEKSIFHKQMVEHAKFFDHKTVYSCSGIEDAELYAVRIPPRPSYYYGPQHIREVLDEVCAAEMLVRISASRRNSLATVKVSVQIDEKHQLFTMKYYAIEGSTERESVLSVNDLVEVAPVGYFNDIDQERMNSGRQLTPTQLMEPVAALFRVTSLDITKRGVLQVTLCLNVKDLTYLPLFNEIKAQGQCDIRKYVQTEELKRHQRNMKNLVKTTLHCIGNEGNDAWRYVLTQLLGSMRDASNRSLLAHRIDHFFSDVDESWVRTCCENFDFHPNDEQVDSIVMGMRERISLIHGPPGTGKTTVVVHMIALMVKWMNDKLGKGKGKKILVCAPSNVAVGLLASQLHNLKFVDERRRALKVVRYGSRSFEMSRGATFTSSKDVELMALALANATEEERHKYNIYRSGKMNKQERKNFKHWLQPRVDEVLRSADVICCTNSSASSNLIAKHVKQCSILVNDESGQATESDTFGAFSNSMFDHVVLAGDHLQLRPYMLSKSLIEHGYQISTFERIIENSRMAKRNYDEMINNGLASTKTVNPREWTVEDRMLKINYRSVADVVELISRVYYGGELRHNPNRQQVDPPHESLKDMKNIMFYDLSHSRERRCGSGSYANDVEASAIIQTLKILIENGVEERKISVITPYQGQLLNIKRLIGQKTYNRNNSKSDSYDTMRRVSNVEITSIDGYQGGENTYVLVSLVRANSKNESTDPVKVLGFLTNRNRSNVALSRAKDYLLLFGNRKALSVDYQYRQILQIIDAKQGSSQVW